MTRWRCRLYQPWLVDYADGILDGERTQRLERHLSDCSVCRVDVEALRDISQTLRGSAVPDPGATFWREQRQTIGRSIRNLPPPHAGWSLEWLREVLQFSPWRYPIAATAGLLLAVAVYRLAERPGGSGSSAIATQLAALDPEVLGELADAVTPSDDALNYNPHEDEVALAALGAGDLVGTHLLSHVPDETDLTDGDLEGVDEMI